LPDDDCGVSIEDAALGVLKTLSALTVDDVFPWLGKIGKEIVVDARDPTVGTSGRFVDVGLAFESSCEDAVSWPPIRDSESFGLEISLGSVLRSGIGVVDLVTREAAVEIVESTVTITLSGAAVTVVNRADSVGNSVPPMAAAGDTTTVPLLMLSGSDWIVGRNGIAAEMPTSSGNRIGDTDTTARDETSDTLLW
jgi:hypothetical protein